MRPNIESTMSYRPILTVLLGTLLVGCSGTSSNVVQPAPSPPAAEASPVEAPFEGLMRYKGREVSAQEVEVFRRAMAYASGQMALPVAAPNPMQPKLILLERLALLQIVSEQARAEGMSVNEATLDREVANAKIALQQQIDWVQKINAQPDPPSPALATPTFESIYGGSEEAFRSVYGQIQLAGRYLAQSATAKPQVDREALRPRATEESDVVALEKLSAMPAYMSGDIFTKAQVRAWMKENKDKKELQNVTEHHQWHQVRARRIMLSYDIMDQWPETLASIKARLEAGESFEALVKEFSDDPLYGDRGGDMGWYPLYRLDIPDEFKFALKTDAKGAKAAITPGRIFIAQNTGSLSGRVLTRIEAFKPGKVYKGAKARELKARELMLKEPAAQAQGDIAFNKLLKDAQRHKGSLRDFFIKRNLQQESIYYGEGLRWHRGQRSTAKFNMETKRIEMTPTAWTNIPTLDEQPEAARAFFDARQPGLLYPKCLVTDEEEDGAYSRFRELHIVRLEERLLPTAARIEERLKALEKEALEVETKRLKCTEGAMATVCTLHPLAKRHQKTIEAAIKRGDLELYPERYTLPQ